jgi:hypothetical protein
MNRADKAVNFRQSNVSLVCLRNAQHLFFFSPTGERLHINRTIPHAKKCLAKLKPVLRACFIKNISGVLRSRIKLQQ